MALTCFVIAFFPASAPVGAQESEQPPGTVEPDPDLESPKVTLETFLTAIQAAEESDDDRQWEPVYKTLDLPDSDGAARKNAARRLWSILKRLDSLEMEVLAPDAAEVKERRLHQFELFPNNPNPEGQQIIRRLIDQVGTEPPGKIVLTRIDADWKVSLQSVEGINEIFSWAETVPEQSGIPSFPGDKDPILTADDLRERAPRWLKGKFFLTLEAWQWLGIAVLIILSTLLSRATPYGLAPIAKALTKRYIGETSLGKARIAMKPLGIAAGATFFVGGLEYLGILGRAHTLLLGGGRFLLAYGLAWSAWTLVSLACNAWKNKARDTGSSYDDMLVPMVRKTLHVLIVVLAMVYIGWGLGLLHVFAPLIAGVGVAGLAVSFAAQDLIKNLFGGMTIFLDRPFKLGDRIIYSGHDGVVESIGFRSVKMRTFSGHLVAVPNAAITNDPVENVSQRPFIRRKFEIEITYDTGAEKTRDAVTLIERLFQEDGIRESLETTVDGEPLPPQVHFTEYRASGLAFQIVYWFSPAVYQAYVEHAQRFNLRLLGEFEKAGIEFAFPSQTIYLAGEGKEPAGS